MTQRRKTKTNKGTEDYSIDPITRRARFLKNNKAALVHGGYSQNVDESLLNSALENDLAFETGILKGQLFNITTIGTTAVNQMMDSGDEVGALHLALACADRVAKLAPQVQKLLESELSHHQLPDLKKEQTKKRILKKFQSQQITASEVAFNYALHELGSVPQFIMYALIAELKNQTTDVEDEIFTREELEQKAKSYWEQVAQEENQKIARKAAISIAKRTLRDNKNLDSSKN